MQNHCFFSTCAAFEISKQANDMWQIYQAFGSIHRLSDSIIHICFVLFIFVFVIEFSLSHCVCVCALIVLIEIIFILIFWKVVPSLSTRNRLEPFSKHKIDKFMKPPSLARFNSVCFSNTEWHEYRYKLLISWVSA